MINTNNKRVIIIIIIIIRLLNLSNKTKQKKSPVGVMYIYMVYEYPNWILIIEFSITEENKREEEENFKFQIFAMI